DGPRDLPQRRREPPVAHGVSVSFSSRVRRSPHPASSDASPPARIGAVERPVAGSPDAFDAWTAAPEWAPPCPALGDSLEDGAGVTAPGGGIWPALVTLHVPGFVTSPGRGSAGGSAKAGAALKSTMSRRFEALASRNVMAPRFHLVS